ncbi:MAG: hypothetical protein HC806_07890, partial [Anaerolineae bacterium]|nr:hypothetical protein [Anaerolineae bacterium]
MRRRERCNFLRYVPLLGSSALTRFHVHLRRGQVTCPLQFTQSLIIFPMSARKFSLFSFSTLVIILVSYLIFAYQNKPVDLTRIQPGDFPNIPATTDSIRIFQGKIKQNPADAASYTVLGNFFLRAARETGDVTYYGKAETAFLTALKWVPDYTLAQTSLASTYYAQHAFFPALELSQQVYARRPDNIQALATIGDAYLSLGNYPEAERAYQQLSEFNSSPEILVRLAHLEELKGKPEAA